MVDRAIKTVALGLMAGLVFPSLLIAVLPRPHGRSLLLVGDQTVELESLGILDLLRCRAGVAVGIAVQSSVLGAILVRGL